MPDDALLQDPPQETVAPPTWEEVRADPRFAKQNTEGKLNSLNRWAADVDAHTRHLPGYDRRRATDYIEAQRAQIEEEKPFSEKATSTLKGAAKSVVYGGIGLATAAAETVASAVAQPLGLQDDAESFQAARTVGERVKESAAGAKTALMEWRDSRQKEIAAQFDAAKNEFRDALRYGEHPQDETGLRDWLESKHKHIVSLAAARHEGADTNSEKAYLADHDRALTQVDTQRELNAFITTRDPKYFESAFKRMTAPQEQKIARANQESVIAGGDRQWSDFDREILEYGTDPVELATTAASLGLGAGVVRTLRGAAGGLRKATSVVGKMSAGAAVEAGSEALTTILEDPDASDKVIAAAAKEAALQGLVIGVLGGGTKAGYDAWKRRQSTSIPESAPESENDAAGTPTEAPQSSPSSEVGGADSTPVGGDSFAPLISQKGNWRQAALPDGSGIVGGRIEDNTLRISAANLAEDRRGQGKGRAMYQTLVDSALNEGLQVASDSTVDEGAVRVYDSLARSGYQVTRHPDAQTIEVDGLPALAVPEGQSVFTITGSTPEVQNAEIEARLATGPRTLMDVAMRAGAVDTINESRAPENQLANSNDPRLSTELQPGNLPADVSAATLPDLTEDEANQLVSDWEPSLRADGQLRTGQRLRALSAEEYAKLPQRAARSLDFARALTGVFGRRVVVVEGLDAGQIAGATNPRFPRTVFLNAKSPNWHATAGHEMLHHLEVGHPDLFVQLDLDLKPMLTRMESARANYASYTQEADPDLNVRREVYADFLSDSFHDPQFWSQLSERQPRIFTPLARAVWGWFDKVLTALKVQGWESSQYFHDLQNARARLADAMSEFALREHPLDADGNPSRLQYLAPAKTALLPNTAAVAGVNGPGSANPDPGHFRSALSALRETFPGLVSPKTLVHKNAAEFLASNYTRPEAFSAEERAALATAEAVHDPLTGHTIVFLEQIRPRDEETPVVSNAFRLVGL